MSLLSAHLDQIGFSCQGIDSLPFPPPKIFTNALLSHHDITSLIRDTESHERALFSVPPPPPPPTKPADQQEVIEHQQKRRRTVFNVAGDVDVDVLLRGAEKLCGVYELPGARERIAALRVRHRNGRNTAAYYEAKVAEQAEALASLNKKDWMEDEGDEEEKEDEDDVWTVEDLRREEEEARGMEAKKRELQLRLRAMEKDLAALKYM
uniref:DASH complex subunit SPC34 n=1 Tax=Bionectria ochroleuca TaxID=29856 RepID=A0A0B7JVG0_BIOOC